MQVQVNLFSCLLFVEKSEAQNLSQQLNDSIYGTRIIRLGLPNFSEVFCQGGKPPRSLCLWPKLLKKGVQWAPKFEKMGESSACMYICGSPRVFDFFSEVYENHVIGNLLSTFLHLKIG